MNITTLLRLLVLVLSLAALRGPAAVRSDKSSQAGGTPPVIDEQPIGRTVTAGGHVALSVIAHAANPISYQWSKNGQLQTNSTRLSGATNLVLNIDPVLTGDAGSYSAVVTSSGGAVTSAPVSLVVSNLVISAPIPTGTGAVFNLSGQIGDVYRMELSLNFGSSWTTNGYATNRTGSTSYFDNGAGGGLRQFRAAVDRMLPVMYRLDPTNGTAGFRAYGKLGQVWRCDTSSNLPTWTSLGTVSNATGWVTFYDPRLTLPPVRFYRISPP